jgi:hypothetical protein
LLKLSLLPLALVQSESAANTVGKHIAAMATTTARMTSNLFPFELFAFISFPLLSVSRFSFKIKSRAQNFEAAEPSWR